MGYYVRHLKKKKSPPNWKLQYVSCKKSDQKPESTTKEPKTTWNIPKERWRSLGLHPTLTLDEARVRAKQLNAQFSLKRQEEKLRKIQLEGQQFRLKHNAVLPDAFVAEFEERFVRPRRKLPDPKKQRQRVSKRYLIWKAAQKMITTIGLEPTEWFYYSTEVYDYFYQQQFSLGYVKAALNMANLWGYFISRKLCKPFLPIPSPRGYERQRLLEAYYQKQRGCRRPSKPITPQELEQGKNQVKQECFNWLYLSVWLGLRPLEIDSLHDDEMWKIETLPTGRKVLWVFQTKIIALPPEDRWKPIPILHDEQQFAIKIIESNTFKRPHSKTVRKHFGEGKDLYAGRKGFVDLMLSKGHSMSNISIWMGHSSLSRTWRSYKNKRLYHV